MSGQVVLVPLFMANPVGAGVLVGLALGVAALAVAQGHMDRKRAEAEHAAGRHRQRLGLWDRHQAEQQRAMEETHAVHARLLNHLSV